MLRVSVMLGHFQFHWSWVLYTQCATLSIQFTHCVKYMYECRHAFRGAKLFWTVVECLVSTYVPYVVSLHTQRRDKQRWQGVWKSQHVKERILIWVFCICSWQARDLQNLTQIALPRPESHDSYSQMKTYWSDLIWGWRKGQHHRRWENQCWLNNHRIFSSYVAVQHVV
jgi:hypothetical protein